MKASEQRLWEQFGQMLPESGNIYGIHPAVAGAIRNGKATQHWLIACSGGADSVACAGWMSLIANQLGHTVALAHYNHRWRGKESGEDCDFVKALALRLGVQCFSGAAAHIPTQTTETSARAERMAFLREQAQIFSADAILFGHQLDDVAESLLLRIGRGAGTEGMAAPRPVHSFAANTCHWRPFLHLCGDTLRNCLRAAGIDWREDPSNHSTIHPRNAMRMHILPQLEQLEQRSYRHGAARTRMLLEDDANALDALARERLPELYQTPPVMRWRVPPDIQPALLRRGFSAWLMQLQPNKWPPAVQLDSAITSLSSAASGKLLQTDRFLILLQDEQVSCEPIPMDPVETTREPMALNPGIPAEWSRGSFVGLWTCKLSSSQRRTVLQGRVDPSREIWLDAESVQKANGGTLQLALRQRKPGDRYRPLGAPGKRKLARILMDQGIPQKERCQLPVVVTTKDTLLWVPGLAPAHDFRILTTSMQALRLTYGPSAST
jgi:tRNA(Ile)-lysidine synthase